MNVPASKRQLCEKTVPISMKRIRSRDIFFKQILFSGVAHHPVGIHPWVIIIHVVECSIVGIKTDFHNHYRILYHDPLSFYFIMEFLDSQCTHSEVHVLFSVTMMPSNGMLFDHCKVKPVTSRRSTITTHAPKVSCDSVME